MREGTLTSKIVKVFKRQRAIVYVAVGSEFESGWPDRWVGWNGFSVWIEFKVGKRKLTPLQAYTIKQLRKAGIAAFCVRLFDDETCEVEGENLAFNQLLPRLRELARDNGIKA